MIPVFRSLVKATSASSNVRPRNSCEHQAAVCSWRGPGAAPLILAIQRLNILNQYNLRVQRTRGRVRGSETDQGATRIEQSDPLRGPEVCLGNEVHWPDVL